MKSKEEIEEYAVERSPDPKTRKIIAVLSVLALLSFLASTAAAWIGWDESREDAISGAKLAERVRLACADPLTKVDLGTICDNAKDVVRSNDPEIQDSEIDDPDPNDPEYQESEIQEPEVQEPEIPDREVEEPEVQETETQEAENQEAEIQDAEVDDPDPNDPPTQEQVNIAIAKWCTENPEQCRGPQGEPGPQGPQGPAGATDCSTAVVCQGEMDAALEGLRNQVVGWIRALTCSLVGGNPNMGCNIENKP